MDIKTIKRRAIRGAFSLTVRRIILFAISIFVQGIFVPKIFSVEVNGIFNLANSVIMFFTFFSDIGLAAAIIQKKDLKKEDLETTFFIQEILAILITVIVFFSAPFLGSLYHLDMAGIWLIRVLGLGFFLTSLKVIPSVVLERELKFGKLVWVDVAETITYNGLLVVFGLMNLGVASFSWSILVRSIAGVGLIYSIAPWKISFGFSKSAAKELINFGAPFQLNSFLALLKDRLVPLVVAGIVGLLGVGYIGAAQRLAFLPLEVMNIVSRVIFPTYSRLQHDKESLKKALEFSLFSTGLFLYPMLFGILAITPSLFEYLGMNKWGPAMPLVYLFSLAAFWATLSSPFTIFLNAIGKIGITLKLMIMWTILEWILSPILAIYFGFLGVGFAAAIISFTSVIPLIIIKKMINIDIIGNIWQPLLASTVMAALVYYLAAVIPTELPTIIIMIVSGAIIYFGFVILLAKDKIKLSLKELIDALRSR